MYSTPEPGEAVRACGLIERDRTGTAAYDQSLSLAAGRPDQCPVGQEPHHQRDPRRDLADMQPAEQPDCLAQDSVPDL